MPIAINYTVKLGKGYLPKSIWYHSVYILVINFHFIFGWLDWSHCMRDVHAFIHGAQTDVGNREG